LLTRRQVLALGTSGLSALVVACGTDGRQGLGAPGTPAPTIAPSTVPVVPTTPPTLPGVDPGEVAAANAGRVPTQWGVDVDGVHTRLVDAGAPGAPTLALTFDACGGPGGSGIDQTLVDLLVDQQVPATLFLNLRWIDANPALAEQLAASDLFELGNHGSRHLPLSVTGASAYGIVGTASATEAADEVWANHQRLIELTGQAPRWFRSGTAHYDEVATAIAVELGEQPVGFTTNGDLGATASQAQVAAALVGAPAGGIVLAHMNQPAGATAAGVADALPALRAAGTRLVTLSAAGGTRP
jgi:peptidoglycan/xylan/chitin deacetylase (PgdA/CDA1 family)